MSGDETIATVAMMGRVSGDETIATVAMYFGSCEVIPACTIL